jgi:hypothetical protein
MEEGGRRKEEGGRRKEDGGEIAEGKMRAETTENWK